MQPGLSDQSEGQQMRNRIQPYQLSQDWNFSSNVEYIEYDKKSQKQPNSTNLQCANSQNACEPQNIYNISYTREQHVYQEQETPIDFGINYQGQSPIRYKVSTYKTVLRLFYENVRQKISEKEGSSQWKQIMRNQLKMYKQKYKGKRFKYNIASMDHLFCKESGLPEGTIKQNRKFLIQLLKSQKFKTKIKKSKHFKQHKRVKYLIEAKLIFLKIQRQVKSFAEKIEEQKY